MVPYHAWKRTWKEEPNPIKNWLLQKRFFTNYRTTKWSAYRELIAKKIQTLKKCKFWRKLWNPSLIAIFRIISDWASTIYLPTAQVPLLLLWHVYWKNQKPFRVPLLLFSIHCYLISATYRNLEFLPCIPFCDKSIMILLSEAVFFNYFSLI